MFFIYLFKEFDRATMAAPAAPSYPYGHRLHRLYYSIIKDLCEEKEANK